jgi:type VI secretion system VasD/TssJ family lipoprotein
MRRETHAGKNRQRSGSMQIVAAALLSLGLLSLGCAGGAKPAEVCLSLVASPNLNSFDGQAHVVVVLLYPLQNISAFNTTDPVDLLRGVKPPGLTGDPWEVTVYPGEIKKLEEKLPRDTVFVGVVADFYSGPSRTVVDADCATFGLGGAKIALSSNDLQAE